MIKYVGKTLWYDDMIEGYTIDGESMEVEYCRLMKQGYLAAMNGPEVAALVELLRYWQHLHCSLVEEPPFHNPMCQEMTAALANWEVADG